MSYRTSRLNLHSTNLRFSLQVSGINPHSDGSKNGPNSPGVASLLSSSMLVYPILSFYLPESHNPEEADRDGAGIRRKL